MGSTGHSEDDAAVCSLEGELRPVRSKRPRVDCGSAGLINNREARRSSAPGGPLTSTVVIVKLSPVGADILGVIEPPEPGKVNVAPVGPSGRVDAVVASGPSAVRVTVGVVPLRADAHVVEHVGAADL
jgi:hypothetical protein